LGETPSSQLSTNNRIYPQMSARANWSIAAAACACFAAGVTLSHRVVPGVSVQAVTLAGDTPALQFLPAGSGPHPVALLAHGITASKETLFRFGEAFAAAGFECYAVDLPGHGESARPFSFNETAPALDRVAHSLGSVDVFLGHSMGAYAGAGSVRDGNLNPRLFIAVGASPNLGEHGPPLLLLAGRFDEAFPPAQLKTRTDARLVISPWCDHAFEPYDSCLVDPAVEAACAAVGKTPPAAPTCWHWRLVGMALGILGALGLVLSLPKFPTQWAWVRGLLVPAIYIVAITLTSSTWLGVEPLLRRFPLYIGMTAIGLFIIIGAGKLRIPRWSFLALTVVAWIGSLIAGANILAFFISLFALILSVGTILGAIAAHRGSRRAGDIALAIFMGYALGQWIPIMY